MIGDKLDGAVLALIVGGGAAVLLGIVGIFNQPLAERIWGYLLLTGAGVPFLAIVALETVIRARSAAAQNRLDHARAWALEVDTELKTAAEPAAEVALPITEQLSRLERQRLQQVAHWQLYFRRLWAAATAYGWDIRTLTDKRRPTCVTSQGGWNLATDQLVAAGYLRKDTAGTVPLVTDADWQAGRLWERVPAPSGEPPDIAPPPYSTPQQKTGQTAANTVIEHERA